MNCDQCKKPISGNPLPNYTEPVGYVCWSCLEAFDKEADRLLTQFHQRRIEPVEGPEHEDRII